MKGSPEAPWRQGLAFGACPHDTDRQVCYGQPMPCAWIRCHANGGSARRVLALPVLRPSQIWPGITDEGSVPVDRRAFRRVEYRTKSGLTFWRWEEIDGFVV